MAEQDYRRDWYNLLSKEDILRAIRLFDAVGYAVFNKRTGFLVSTDFIRYKDRPYDCKSIMVGAYLLKFDKPNHHFKQTEIADLLPLLSSFNFVVERRVVGSYWPVSE